MLRQYTSGIDTFWCGVASENIDCRQPLRDQKACRSGRFEINRMSCTTSEKGLGYVRKSLYQNRKKSDANSIQFSQRRTKKLWRTLMLVPAYWLLHTSAI